jgi:hypothetical protein
MASMQVVTPKMIVLVDSKLSEEFVEGEVVVFEGRLAMMDGNGGMAWIEYWVVGLMRYMKNVGLS